MNRRYRNLGMVLTLLAIAVPASAAPVRSEHVTGGTLQLNWENGFGVSNKMKPLTLVASDPGFANPGESLGHALNGGGQQEVATEFDDIGCRRVLTQDEGPLT